MWILGILAFALLVVAAGVGFLAWRRIRLLRVGGVDVALRTRVDDTARGWHLGIAHYRGDVFAWYRVLGLRSRADRVLHRRRVRIESRRDVVMAEAYTMPSATVVLRCHSVGADGVESDVELAMGPDALTGFLSWLESSPPGHSVREAS